MPRSSSRHRTHRSKKHRDRWDVEPEKEMGEEEDLRKRKERAEEVSSVADRWNGDFDDRREEVLDFEGDVDIEKIEEVKLVAVDSKSKSSRRSECPGERKEERRSGEKEKESSRRDSGGGRRNGEVKVRERERDSSASKDGEHVKERNTEYGFVKDKERGRESEKETRSERDREGNKDRERWSEKERERGMDIDSERESVVDSRQEKITDLPRRSSQVGGDDRKYLVKGDSEIPERQLPTQLSSPGCMKDLQKQMGKGGSVEKDKWLGSERVKDDKKLHAVDDCRGSSNYRKEGYKEGRYREKHQEDFDRDQQRLDHWHHGNIRSEDKHHRTEDKQLDMQDGSRIVENDHDGNWKKDKHSTGYKDTKRSKRTTDDNEEHRSLKSSVAGFSRANDQTKDSQYYKVDDADISRPESRNSGRIDSTPRRSTTSISSASKEDDRSIFKERDITTSVYSVDHTRVSGASGRGLKSQSVDDSVEESVPSQHERTRLDGYASPTYSTDKRSSSKGSQYPKRKTSGHSGDIEEIRKKKSYSRDGKETHDDSSQNSLASPSLSGAFSLSDGRPDYFGGSSPTRIPPITAGDRRSSGQYRRNGHPTTGRGQGYGWRGVANWPSPIGNGFAPFHHGPSPGFHPVAHHFSSPIFDVRPFIEIHHATAPFHVHGTSERFSAHNFPSSWQTSDDSCPPNFQGWDRSHSVIGDDSHMYGRPEWKHNRHLVNNKSWEMDDEKLKEIQNSNFFPSHSKSDHPTQTQIDDTGSEQADYLIKPLNDSDVKPYTDNPAKDDAGIPHGKRLKLSNTSNLPDDNDVNICSSYLSMLDISLDLIPQELYEKCTGILGTENTVTDGASAPLSSQVNSGGVKMAIKASKQFGYRLFPQLPDDIYRKAIALYEMGNEERKSKLSSILPLEVDGAPSNKLGGEKPKPDEINKSIEEDFSVANTDNHVDEASNGCNFVKDIPSSVTGRESDTISDALVFASQSSPGDDGLMPDCLSRIHGSESTH